MGQPINRLPEAASPLVAILEMSPEKGGKIGKPHVSWNVASDGSASNSEGAAGSGNEWDKDCLGTFFYNV